VEAADDSKKATTNENICPSYHVALNNRVVTCTPLLSYVYLLVWWPCGGYGDTMGGVRGERKVRIGNALLHISSTMDDHE
jgi:hypothetical protein